MGPVWCAPLGFVRAVLVGAGAGARIDGAGRRRRKFHRAGLQLSAATGVLAAGAPARHISDHQDDSLPADQLDPGGAGPGVYAVRTDLPPHFDMMAATVNQLTAARLGSTTAAALCPPAPVTSLAHLCARRAGHPCTEPVP